MQTITLEEAQARLLEVVHCVMSEKVELLRSIDRILAEDVYAHVSQPPFERSAMDGYAVRSEDIRTVSRSNPVCLKVIDRVCAGEVTDKRIVLSNRRTRIMVRNRSKFMCHWLKK